MCLEIDCRTLAGLDSTVKCLTARSIITVFKLLIYILIKVSPPWANSRHFGITFYAHLVFDDVL